MPATLQNFLEKATLKAYQELTTAFLNLPEEKRTWSPETTARTALDQIVECTLLNGYTAELIQTHVWSDSHFAQYPQARAELSEADWDSLNAQLKSNTDRVIAVIHDVDDDALGVEIAMPWGSQTLAEIIAYPFWNMSYHNGQINYIASLLGPLA